MSIIFNRSSEGTNLTSKQFINNCRQSGGETAESEAGGHNSFHLIILFFTILYSSFNSLTDRSSAASRLTFKCFINTLHLIRVCFLGVPAPRVTLAAKRQLTRTWTAWVTVEERLKGRLGDGGREAEGETG